jgi:predicted permease
MAWLIELARRLRFLARREKFNRELDEELRTHLELKTRTNLQQGLAPEEARFAAQREFGNALLLREQSRDFWGYRWLEQLAADLRFGLRMLARNPGFAAVAVLTLALGIGVNSVIFSVISTMLLRKPPVHDPDRLMMLFSRNVGAVGSGDEASRSPVSPPDFLDWRAQTTAFAGIAAASTFEGDESQTHLTVSGGSEPERVPGGAVSANYFDVLGVSPLLGRAFLPGEDQAGHDRVMLLRADLWKRSFGGDPRVLGRTVKVNGEAYTVIGVMPDTFRQLWMFPEQLWIPLTFTPAQLSPAGRAQRSLSVFGRLKPGVSEARARSELQTIAKRIAASNPETNKDWGSANVLTLQEYAIQESSAGPALAFLMATVGFVLLIACANIANLLLARNASRQREFAIRAALGAGRLRVVRQLLSECLLLALFGGGLGLLFAAWGVHLLRGVFSWNEWSVLISEQLSIDRNVLFFTLAVSVVTALVFGLAPAFQVSRRDPNSAIKEGSRSTTAGREHHRLQNLLVAGQLALSLILLVGAGLFVKSFVEEMQSKPGMNPHNVLTASISLTGKFYKDPAHQLSFFQGVLHRLADSPEVNSAAVASDLPFTFPGRAHFLIEGQPAHQPDSKDWRESWAGYFAVSPGYFGATQIPLRAGREFTRADDAGSAPVVIVNEAFARKFFANGALGRYISVSPEGASTATAGDQSGSTQRSWREIVGVVGDVNEYVGQTTWRPHVFVPFLQAPDASMNFVVRVRADPAGFAASLRRAVWSVDKDQPVTNLRTMDRVFLDSGQGDDVMADLMGAFAMIALLMAAVGIYGLIAYLVGRRTHELGVRMALGARRCEVLLLVLRSSMPMLLAGVGLGFLISLAMPRLVSASFQDFHVHSGWILAGTPVAVLLVALASCYLPARRASKVEPTMALRCE